MTNCPYLYWFGINDNQITTLDVSKNTYLQWLSAEKNKLTTLDLANNTGIQGLSLQNNQMNAEAINSIIDQLQDVSNVTVDDTNRDWARQLNISYMPGTAEANVNAATLKGWYVTAENTSSVIDINTDKAEVAREYFSINGQALGSDVASSGVYILKTIYSDGSVEYTKVNVAK